MSATRLRYGMFAVLALLAVGHGPVGNEEHVATKSPGGASRLPVSFAKQPLRFETNVGQAADGVRFIAQGGGVRLSMEDSKATLRVRRGTKKNAAPSTELTLSVPGARKVTPVASEELATKVNYLVGDRPSWRTNIATYSKVTYPSVLDGVDLVYHGEKGSLEYDFVVAPGADPSTVALEVAGSDRLALNDKGDLRIETSTGTIVQERPYVFQRDEQGGLHEVRASFRLKGANRIGFEVASYDHSKPLVIDPVYVAYATYLGNSEGWDAVSGIAADASGAAYVVGTSYADAPPPGYGSKYKSLVPQDLRTQGEGSSEYTKFFVARLNSTGQLDYITYGGGNGRDTGNAITIDGAGNTFITGQTSSNDLPTTDDSVSDIASSAYVAELSANGQAYLSLQILKIGFGSAETSDVGYGITLVSNTIVVGGNAYRHTDEAPTGCDDEVCRLETNDNNSCQAGQCVCDDLRCKQNEGAYSACNGEGDCECNTQLCQALHQGNQAYQCVEGSCSFTGARTAGPQGDPQDPGGGTSSGGVGIPTCDRSMCAATDICQPLLLKKAAPQGASTFCTTPISGAFAVGVPVGGGAPTFTRVYGGGDSAAVNSVTKDAANNVYIAGTTFADLTAVPVTGGYKTTWDSGRHSFVARIAIDAASNGSAVYGTYFTTDHNTFDEATAAVGGADGQVYVTGPTSTNDCTDCTSTFPSKSGLSARHGGDDAYIVHLDTNTSGTDGLVYSAFVGTDSDDAPNGIAVDGLGQAYVTGSLLTDGPSAMFLTVISADGNTQVASEVVHGSGSDYATSIAIRGTNVFVGGTTTSPNVSLPTTVTDGVPAQPALADSESSDGYIAKFSIAPLAILPASVTLATGASVKFTVTGGSGAPYTFTVNPNNSGATISSTGVYTAGSRDGVTDTVVARDHANNQVTAVVVIKTNTVPTDLKLEPGSQSTPPRGSLTFTATGGTAPYTWTISSNASGGSVTSSGLYKAGSAGLVTDAVRVVDANGITRTSFVNVGAPITITPPQARLAQKGTQLFLASGGANGPYKWTTTAGEITAGGLFTAPSQVVVANITATDSLGNTGTVTASVGGALAISPAQPRTFPKGTVSLSVFGGSGQGYVWTVINDPAKGSTVNAASGLFTAGPTGDVEVQVDARDSNNNHAIVVIKVGPGLSISPTNEARASGQQVAFAATGGSGEQYAYRLEPNASQGSVGQDGLYTAGPTSGTDTVVLTDSVGNRAQATVNVTAQPAPPAPTTTTTTPPPATTAPSTSVGNGQIEVSSVGGGDECAVGPIGTTTTSRFSLGAGVLFAISLLIRRRRAAR